MRNEYYAIETQYCYGVLLPAASLSLRKKFYALYALYKRKDSICEGENSFLGQSITLFKRSDAR